MIRYFGGLAQAHLYQEKPDQALEAARAGLRLIRQKPFAGLWTMEGYAGVAETFLALSAKAEAKEACRAMREFARVFSVAGPRARLQQGLYELLDVQPVQARRAWQKSLTLAEQLSMPFELARAHAAMSRHSDDASMRHLHSRKAMDIYSELGIPADLGTRAQP
jgi:hypothetical protein